MLGLLGLGILLAGVRWADGIPVEGEAGPEITLPGGQALRLVLDPADLPPGSLPILETAAGEPVAWQGLEDGLLVPATASTRQLRIGLPSGVEAMAHLQSWSGRSERWSRWERRAWRAARRGAAPPPPPDGPPGLAAALAARQAGIGDRALRLWGLVADLALVEPLTGSTHPERPLELDEGVLRVSGPATLLIHATPAQGWSRFGLMMSLDGHAQPVARLVADLGTTRQVRIWVPPGSHEVGIQASDPQVTLETGLLRRRPRMRPVPAFRPSGTGVDAAEWRALLGDREGALAGFRTAVEASGSVGALARLRVLQLSEDPAELAPLARVALDRGGPTLEPVARAILDRGRLLPEALVLEALDQLDAPDLPALARWLDSRPDARPLGEALPEIAGLAMPVAPGDLSDLARGVGLDARFVHLDPSEAGEGEIALLAPAGPGVPRAVVEAGDRVQVEIPLAPLDRKVILRLHADSPVAFQLDGPGRAQSYDAGPGKLDLALSPGRWTLEVTSGALVAHDPELLLQPKIRYERRLVALPAEWTLPGAAVPVALRLDRDGAEPLLAAFDDGSLVRVEGGSLSAPAGARSVRLMGAGAAGLSMRMPLRIADPTADPLPTCVEAPLEHLAALSQAVGEGDPAARVARAEWLACLGLAAAARREVGEDALAAAQVEEIIRRHIPTALEPGPQTVTAALGALGIHGPIPEDADEIERLARAHPEQAALWMAAAEAREAATDPADLGGAAWEGARAIADAQAAGADGRDLLARLAGRLDLPGPGRARRRPGAPHHGRHPTRVARAPAGGPGRDAGAALGSGRDPPVARGGRRGRPLGGARWREARPRLPR